MTPMLKQLFEEAGVRVEIASFVDEGPGRSSYPVDLGDGTALVIDPAIGGIDAWSARQQRVAAR